jgi:hypothetical protein
LNNRKQESDWRRKEWYEMKSRIQAGDSYLWDLEDKVIGTF